MTAKRAKKRKPVSEMGFNEALARFVHADPKEVEDEIEKLKREEREAAEYVEERRESIRRGTRRAPKRFRL
jgi:hypothetical protein